MPAKEPLPRGTILNNRYRIVKLIGQGGFGAVYRAWDLNLNAPYALKENYDISPEAARQFAREATILARLRHTHLPVVIDHFSIRGQGQYLVMEFVEGEDLQTKLNRSNGPLPESLVLPWIEQVCDALIYLHNQSPPIIHRDIKPANIKITPDGNVKLVDFGIAKIFDPKLKTTIGARAVTPGYSPPEQYGQGVTDARSDIYALGATLYTLLTANIPVESVERQLGRPLPSPSSLNSSISPQVEAAILSAMQLSANLRCSNALEFKTALQPKPTAPMVPDFPAQIASYAPTQIPAQAPAQPSSKPVLPRRNRLWVIIAIVAILGLFGIAFGAGLFMSLPTTSQATETQFARSISMTQTALAFLLNITPTPVIILQDQIETPAQTITSVSSPSQTKSPTKTPTTPVPSSTSTPSKTPTATQDSAFTWQPCTAAYPSRLQVGDRAYVSFNPPLANNVRSSPAMDAAILGKIQPGEEVEILDGPACAHSWVWWYVRALKDNLTGWTAEGDIDNYWLVPMP